jgi:hypothetical protein
MGLRVLDDDRAGFALLAFSGSSDRQSISISIRSLREGAFLGPAGAWQKAPHYFDAERTGGDARETFYRVGPEIVNHLLEHDRIGVADADGTVHEEALWENAIPQMIGQSTRHSIYRPPSAVVNRISVLETPKPQIEQPAVAPKADVPPPTEPARIERPEPPPKPLPSPPPPKPVWLKALPLVLVAVVALAIASIPKVRCQLFGISCAVPDPIRVPDDDALRLANACATPKLEAAPCEVRACFSAYLAKTAPDKVASSARSTLDEADGLCLQNRRRDDAENSARLRKAAEEKALQSARQCAAGASDCIVKNCYAGYLAEYGNSGAFGDRARAEVAGAENRCQPKPPDSPSPPAIADGVYNAGAHPGCRAAAQFGIHVTVKAGTVIWEHELRGTRYTWSGTIDGRGNIRASVGNSSSFTASGRYSDSEHDVQMIYPQCGSDPITLSIIGRL